MSVAFHITAGLAGFLFAASAASTAMAWSKAVTDNRSDEEIVMSFIATIVWCVVAGIWAYALAVRR